MLKKLSIYQKEMKILLLLSLPISIGQIGQVLMGIIDNAMVGRVTNLGSTYISALGVANSVYFCVFIFGVGLMVSVSSLISHYLSRKRNDLISQIFKNSLLVSLIASVIINIIMVYLTNNFNWFVPKDAVVAEYAKEYLYIVLWGTPFLLAGTGLKNFIDGLSFTKMTMIVTLSGLVVNVFLNWIFIYGNLGFEATGVKGAAVATNWARFYIFIIQLLVVLYHKNFAEFRPFHFKINLKDRTFIEIFKIGIPSGFQYFFEIAAFSMAAILASYISTNDSAAHQIAIGLGAFTYMFSTGISVGASIRTGHFVSLRDPVNAKHAGISALYLVTIFMMINAALFIIFKDLLPLLFTEDSIVVDIASGLLVIAAIFQIPDGIQAVNIGVLRGYKDVKLPTYFAAASYWLVAIPLAFLFIFQFGWGISGLWIGLTLGLTFAAILLYYRFMRISKKV